MTRGTGQVAVVIGTVPRPEGDQPVAADVKVRVRGPVEVELEVSETRVGQLHGGVVIADEHRGAGGADVFEVEGHRDCLVAETVRSESFSAVGRTQDRTPLGYRRELVELCSNNPVIGCEVQLAAHRTKTIGPGTAASRVDVCHLGSRSPVVLPELAAGDAAIGLEIQLVVESAELRGVGITASGVDVRCQGRAGAVVHPQFVTVRAVLGLEVQLPATDVEVTNVRTAAGVDLGDLRGTGAVILPQLVATGTVIGSEVQLASVNGKVRKPGTAGSRVDVSNF